MRKTGALLLLIIMSLALLVGCTDTEEKNEAEEQALTIDYFCEYYGISKSEFDGIDFDDFVKYFELTPDKLEHEVPLVLIDVYKKERLGEGLPAYGKMTPTTEDLPSDYQDKLDIIIIDEFISGGATGMSSYTIIDFKNTSVLSSSGDIRFASEKDIIRSTDDALKKSVIEILEKYNISGFERQEPENTSKSSDEICDAQASQSCIKIVLNDGTVYYLSFNKTASSPENEQNFFSMIEDIKNAAK